MTRVDMKKLETAIQYVQRMTEGHNPVNNAPVGEDSVITNPNVVRCMSFIKDILEELWRNQGYIGRRPRITRDKSLPDMPLECLEKFHFTGEKTITKLVDQINGLYDIGNHKKLTYEPIIRWLKVNTYLYERFDNELNKRVTEPTDKGKELGITSERRESRGDAFVSISYGRAAQEFIVQHMGEILAAGNDK